MLRARGAADAHVNKHRDAHNTHDEGKDCRIRCGYLKAAALTWVSLRKENGAAERHTHSVRPAHAKRLTELFDRSIRVLIIPLTGKDTLTTLIASTILLTS